MKRQCTCEFCTMARRYEAIEGGLSVEAKELFRNIFDCWESDSMEAGRYHSLILGSWPNADEVMKKMREQSQSKQPEKAEA